MSIVPGLWVGMWRVKRLSGMTRSFPRNGARKFYGPCAWTDGIIRLGAITPKEFIAAYRGGS